MGAPPRKGFSRICRGPFTGAVTRLIAHRGAAQEAPENSIAAFVDALGLGADGVELDALHLRHEVIDAGLVERTRASGLELAAWTVNESEELSRMAALGVDAVITDELSRARQLLEARGGQLGGGPVGGGPPPVS